MKLINRSSGYIDNSFFGYLLFSVLVIFIISKFISAGNFTGVTGTIFDIIPLAIVGIIFYFLFVKTRV